MQQAGPTFPVKNYYFCGPIVLFGSFKKYLSPLDISLAVYKKW